MKRAQGMRRKGGNPLGSKMPRGYRKQPCRLLLMKKSRHMRRWFLRNPWVRPICVFNYAAVAIQALARRFLVRKEGSLSRYVAKRNNAAKRSGEGKKERQLDKYLAAMSRVKKSSKGAPQPEWQSGGYSVWCAVRLQAWWRMVPKRRRKLYKRRMVNQIAVLIIQTAWRAQRQLRVQLLNALKKQSRLSCASSQQEAEEIKSLSCQKIQLAWRARCNRRIYQYFRDLVRFKLQGAPADLLRTIIPNETELLDRASGVHVRFRLGGAIFPPKIYFKIFTHRPLCDVNAFAPRDYTKEKAPEAFQVHNKLELVPAYAKYRQNIRVGASYFGTIVTTNTGTENWYKRDERNPWRPIASQVFEDILVPPWQREVAHSKKPEPFHFSSLKRKEEMKREKKRRKRQWMMKAYLMAMKREQQGGGDAKMGEDMGEEEEEGEGEEKMFDQRASTESEFEARDSFDEYSSIEEKFTLPPIDPSKLGKLASAEAAPAKKSLVEMPLINNSQKLPQRTLQQKQPTSQLFRPLREEDIDEDLVNWSLALDFEDYAKEWHAVGTSMGSDVPHHQMYSLVAGLSKRKP